MREEVQSGQGEFAPFEGRLRLFLEGKKIG
jgi:hypothetical protein